MISTKKKKFGLSWKFLFIPRSLKTTRNDRSSPHKGPNKKISPKSHYLFITNNEIVQNSKSKPKNSYCCVPLSLVASTYSFNYMTFLQSYNYLDRPFKKKFILNCPVLYCAVLCRPSFYPYNSVQYSVSVSAVSS